LQIDAMAMARRNPGEVTISGLLRFARNDGEAVRPQSRTS
jgi:hypothetical protein